MENMSDDQLDDMLLDKRLEEARAKEAESAESTESPEIPESTESESIQIPYQPGKAPTSERSYLESFGRGAAQGYTSGFSDEITGAAESALTGKDYKTARNESRKAYGQASEDNPKMYGLGMLGGGALQMATPGLNVLGKAGPVLSGMAQGALSGYGMSESDDPTQQAKDAAFGGAIGGAVGKAASAIGNTKLGKYLSNIAEQRAYKAGAGQSIKDLRAEEKAGRVVIDREGMSIARGRDLLSKDEAGPPAVGWLDRTENIVPKVAAKREFFGKAIGDMGKAIDDAIPEGPVSYDEVASIIDREIAKRPSTIENKALSERLHKQLDHIFQVKEKQTSTPTDMGKFLQYLKSQGYESSLEPEILNNIPKTTTTERIVGKPNMSFGDSQKYKSEFQWNPSKNLSAPQNYDYETTLHNAFSEGMENAANKAKDVVPDAAKYDYLKGKYASYRGADEQARARSVQNQTNRFISPSDYAAGFAKFMAGVTGGGMTGYATSGNTAGGLIGATAGALAHKQLRERGSALAGRSANAVAKALESGDKAFGKFAPILNEAMSRGTTNFILTHNLLMQSNPEYQNAVSKISE